MDRMDPETLMRSLLILITFSWVVVERDPQVMGEPEVIVGAVSHPRGQGVPFLLQGAAPGGVQGDPGAGGVPEVFLVLGEQLGLDGVVAGVAGGLGCFFQRQERVDGLLAQSRPGRCRSR